MGGTQAAIRAGYSKAGSTVRGSELLANRKVKVEIARLQAELVVKTETTVESVHGLYNAAYSLALNCNQPSAMVSAVTGIARLYGLDKDVQVAAELPTSITVADAERYRDMADAATADNLSKPKLSKGA